MVDAETGVVVDMAEGVKQLVKQLLNNRLLLMGLLLGKSSTPHNGMIGGLVKDTNCRPLRCMKDR